MQNGPCANIRGVVRKGAGRQAEPPQDAAACRAKIAGLNVAIALEQFTDEMGQLPYGDFSENPYREMRAGGLLPAVHERFKCCRL